jgi:hypothetical protein
VAVAGAVLAALMLASPSAPKQAPPAVDLPKIQQIPTTPAPTPTPAVRATTQPTATPASSARQNRPTP